MENQTQNQNYDPSKSNFFSEQPPNQPNQSQATPNLIPDQSSSQAFPPNISNNNMQIPPYNPGQTQQINFNINQPMYPSSSQLISKNTSPQSFLEKVNTTASGVFDFLKSKAPPIPNKIIPKKLLENVDPLTIISEIKDENFRKIAEKSIKEINCLKLEKTKLNDLTIKVNVSNPKQINNNSLFSKT